MLSNSHAQQEPDSHEREPSFGSQSRTQVPEPTPPPTGDEALPSKGGEINHGQKVTKFVITMRKVYRPLGFHKGYNFPLFVISAGAMLGFTLAKLSNLNIGGSAAGSFKQSSSPGDWYYLRGGHYRFGITLHLATVLPAGLLMVWQFVPVIRFMFPTFHRINGYLVIALIVLSNIGALMIARRSFGGGLDTQSAVGVLVILSTLAIGMGTYNIRKLQIEQHRAWFIRTVFYMGTIITARVIQMLTALIITQINDYYQVQTCGEVASNYAQDLPLRVVALYVQCLNSSSTADTNVVVHADFHGAPEQVGASLGLGFGMGLWMAILLHLVGVEMYLNLTQGESHRLRAVSYERQLEAGYEHPGSAGTTSDRWGDDQPWNPARRPISMVPMIEK